MAAIGESGNSSSCGFTVAVLDQESPLITCPASMQVASAGPDGAPVSFNAVATDNITADHPSAGIIEINGGNTTFLHVFGVVLIISRIAHAIGLKHDNMAHPGRVIGAGGTFLMSFAAAVYAVWMAVKPMFA